MIDLLFKKAADKDRPDYYLTPSHDFTQYTKDCEKKYWSKETAFDWGQDVQENLRKHLKNLNAADFSQVVFMTLPMVRDALAQTIDRIQQEHLPVEEDALKAIGEYLPAESTILQRALEIQSPLQRRQIAVAQLADRLEILQVEAADLIEQQRLELFRQGVQVKHLETEAERRAQATELAQLNEQIAQTEQELKQARENYRNEANRLTQEIRAELLTVETPLLTELKDNLQLVQRTLETETLPTEAAERSRLQTLIFQRQIRGLKDIANHALVVEQSAIAPLTVGIIHYKRHREIQEALTTFVNDEAKHSATFRRFLVEKLAAKEYISDQLIRGANRYMWVARYVPAAGLFLAVIVEAIGAATLEFFSKEEYMPDPLFRSICETISIQDETRHMDLCVAMYNELYRKGTRLEQTRNDLSLRTIMKAVYGDKTEDHALIQAFRAFGVESQVLYDHVVGRLSQQLARVGLYVQPERILSYIG